MDDLQKILEEGGFVVDVFDPSKETSEEWLKRLENEKEKGD